LTRYNSYVIVEQERFMLKNILAGLGERQKHFLILRIAGMDKKMSLSVSAIPEGTYKRWTSQKNFQEVYRQRAELGVEYRDEAIKMLRRYNQLAAVLLEKEIIEKLGLEIQSGDYDLVRTHLGREVYTKLVSELDKVPLYQSISWEQLVLGGQPQPQLTEGEKTDDNPEAAGSEAEEHQEGEFYEVYPEGSLEVSEESIPNGAFEEEA